MYPTCIHHVEFSVHNGQKLVDRFTAHYRFRLAGTRFSKTLRQWLLNSHSVWFLITETTSSNTTTLHNDPTQTFQHSLTTPTAKGSSRMTKGRDSVVNVALRVKDVDATLERLVVQGVQILKAVQTLSDASGYVRLCTVKSCVGNVVHTLVDDSNYAGAFLPGFQSVDSVEQILVDSSDPKCHEISRGDITHVDHIAFACQVGSSASIMHWYERCFGMKRFFINRDDKEDEGFLISNDDVGLRLRAFEYWKCAETGISLEEESMGHVKFVISEALPVQGPNQIDTFLAEHGGPGVQHIGLYTDDIVSVVDRLQLCGVQFNEPPCTYYSEVGRLREIMRLGLDVEALQRCGILLDTETADDAAEDNSETTRYLMQKFTRPLFDEDTFFLEIIQRVGATGFGAGNITALFRSMQAYIRLKDKEQIEPHNSNRILN